MSILVDCARLVGGLAAAERQLRTERGPRPYWSGRLCGSPLATAASVSALLLAERHVDDQPRSPGAQDHSWLSGVLVRTELNGLATAGLHWLAKHQNDDGGWGDSDRCPSNLAATLAVLATFQLTGVPVRYASVLERARKYAQRQGGVLALRSASAEQRLLASAVLCQCAQADLSPWRRTVWPASQFAHLPERWKRRWCGDARCWSRPLSLSIGVALSQHAQLRNPATRWWRWWEHRGAVERIEFEQCADGSFQQSLPATAWVVMNLSSVGLADHPVVRRGLEFLLSKARGDGSWPLLGPQLAWNTALVAGECGWASDHHGGDDALAPRETLDWLLDQQWRQWDCRQGALPGGWSRFARGAGRPTADATSVVLTALRAWCERRPGADDDDVRQAAQLGCEWLLAHQQGDGGWAAERDTAGTLPCEPSALDVTARAWRALERWRRDPLLAREGSPLARSLQEACRRAHDNVAALQDADGSWRPRWLGSPGVGDEANRVLGTSLVLQAFAEAGRTSAEAARRGAMWLADVQYAGGSWGPPPVKRKRKHEFRSETPVEADGGGSIEETAAATAALAPFAEHSDKAAQAVRLGAEWLCAVVLEDEGLAAAPLGFDFAGLWYYDERAPWISAGGALAQLVHASTAGEAARPLELPLPHSAATLP